MKKAEVVRIHVEVSECSFVSVPPIINQSWETLTCVRVTKTTLLNFAFCVFTSRVSPIISLILLILIREITALHIVDIVFNSVCH